MRPSTNTSRMNEWEARYTSTSEHVERLTPSLPVLSLSKGWRRRSAGSW
ncbi:MAG: hypothetical protein HS100_00560 [Anaerolineales bacterium]|nr:hypothetical protein [Anaerolineales bacterium]